MLKRIKNSVVNFYFWVISKYTKMSFEMHLSRLHEMRNQLYIQLQQNGVVNAYNPFSEITYFSNPDDKSELECTIGEYKFVIVAEAHIMTRKLLCRTYKIKKDLSNYPNIIRTEIESLSIEFNLNGYGKFLNPLKEIEYHLFSQIYFSKIQDYIAKKEGFTS